MEHQSHPSSQCHRRQPVQMQSLLSIARDLLATLLLFLGSIHHPMAKDYEIGQMSKLPLTTRYFHISILQAFMCLS